MRFLAALAAMLVPLWPANPALAADFTDMTQDFFVVYVPHGSTGPVELLQYGGPLKIYDVTVKWDSYIERGYEAPDDVPDYPHFDQPYEGFAGFRIYRFTSSGTVVLGEDSGSFSGVSDCTPRYCAVAGGASGSTHLNPLGFAGNQTFWVDFIGEIEPRFDDRCCDSFFYLSLIGSVSYRLGPVPEPASWAMMVSGLGLAGIALRSRRQRPSPV